MRNHELLSLDLKWTEPTDLEENRYICRLEKLRRMPNDLVKELISVENQRINSFGYSKRFNRVKGDVGVLRNRHIKIMNLETEHMSII